MYKEFPYIEGYTHGGTFHADDVFSSALLLILNPDIHIKRGFTPPASSTTCIVYDIGGGEYDHHTEPRESRPNGIKYASFGKLWRTFGPLLLNLSACESIDKNFISELDNTDNTGDMSSLSSVIDNFNYFWDENKSDDVGFFEAVDLALSILYRMIDKYKSSERATKSVLESYNESKDGIVYLSRHMPWSNCLYFKHVNFVVCPSNRGGISVERVDSSDYIFPQSWWGKASTSGVEGLTFCHANGFLCNFDTLEHAKAALDNIVHT